MHLDQLSAHRQRLQLILNHFNFFSKATFVSVYVILISELPYDYACTYFPTQIKA